MRAAAFLSALCAATPTLADPRTAQIYIQPLATTTTKPEPLAEVSYDPLSLDTTSVIAYEAPEIPETADLVRIGLYDPKSSAWISGTTVASVENFSKGYSPNLMLTVDARAGEVLSAAVKGVRIDAGQTRDFGPKAVVLLEGKGKQPELNKPVVLSPEGKKVEEQEKTFLQKYVLLLLLLVKGVANLRQILVDDCYCGLRASGWWRRGEIEGNGINSGAFNAMNPDSKAQTCFAVVMNALRKLSGIGSAMPKHTSPIHTTMSYPGLYTLYVGILAVFLTTEFPPSNIVKVSF